MARSSRTVLLRKKKVRGAEYGRPKGSVPPAEQQAIRTARGW